jgi:hypothetical protein
VSLVTQKAETRRRLGILERVPNHLFMVLWGGGVWVCVTVELVLLCTQPEIPERGGPC